MADIVNLRSFRKRKTREEDARKADENRIRYGRSKSDRLTQKAETDRATALHDGHKRAHVDPPESGDAK